jgi:hypothetical protein
MVVTSCRQQGHDKGVAAKPATSTHGGCVYIVGINGFLKELDQVIKNMGQIFLKLREEAIIW